MIGLNFIRHQYDEDGQSNVRWARHLTRKANKKLILNVRKYEEKITLNNVVRMAETGYGEVNLFKLMYGVKVEYIQVRQMISNYMRTYGVSVL
jgi:hypothetical protein